MIPRLVVEANLVLFSRGESTGPEDAEQPGDQAAQNRTFWPLQALISRIWPSFFLCCWLSAHKQHTRRVFFRYDIRGGWAALVASPPMTWRWVAGPLLHHTPYSQEHDYSSASPAVTLTLPAESEASVGYIVAAD